MKLRALISPVVIVTLVLSTAFSAAEEPQRFHLVVPTEVRSFQPGRYAPFHLEFRNSEFSRMKEILMRCQSEGILPDFQRKPPVLYIYLPTVTMFEGERLRLAAEARRQFEEVYPGMGLEIKFRVLRTNINVSYIYARVKHLLENLKQQSAGDPDAVEYVEALERTNEEAFLESKRALEFTASTARKIKYSIAAARFFTVGSARTLQMLPALSQGGTPAAMAMALIAVDASVEFFTVAFTQKIQRWFTKHPLPVNSAKPTGPNQLSRFINASLWNLILFSVGRPLTMQAMAHAAEANVPAPDTQTAANLLGWNSLGVLFYAAFTNGYNTLRDKGWVSSSQIDIALQISGGFDLATGILSSNPNWYFYRLFTWGPQWGFYALVAALAKIAPVRRDRILAVESTIQDWAEVHEEQTTDASWHIENEQHWQEALERIREIETEADALNCELALSSAKNRRGEAD